MAMHPPAGTSPDPTTGPHPNAPDRTVPGIGPDGDEVAVVTRSGFVESRHRGHGVVVDADGNVLASVGDPTTVLHPRSSLKPLQAATCLVAGAELAGPSLAIGAGSHLGHPDHVELVRWTLASVGLDDDDLQTPPAWPSEPWARDDHVRAGGDRSPVLHNCSGKHTAMLAACVAAGWDTHTYRDPDHPLQRRMRTLVEEVTGVAVDHVGVDGCGAPLFTTTILGLARAIGLVGRAADQEVDEQVATPVAAALGRVARAMRADPWAVAGVGAEDTLVMQALPGVVAKGGAEGVQVLATTDGIGVAVKVSDGRQRAAMPTALALLATAGIDTAAVMDAVAQPTLGHGVPVGRVHVVVGGEDGATTMASPPVQAAT